MVFSPRQESKALFFSDVFFFPEGESHSRVETNSPNSNYINQQQQQNPAANYFSE